MLNQDNVSDGDDSEAPQTTSRSGRTASTSEQERRRSTVGKIGFLGLQKAWDKAAKHSKAAQDAFTMNEELDMKGKLHGRACCLLGPQHVVRRFLHRIVVTRQFEGVILFAIFVSSLAVAAVAGPEGPLGDSLPPCNRSRSLSPKMCAEAFLGDPAGL